MMSTKKLLFTTSSHCLCFLLSFFIICKTANAQEAARYPLIPYPTHLAEAKGYFTLNANTHIIGFPFFTNETMPCMTVLAEILLSGPNNYSTYYQRLEQQYPKPDALHVHYRLPDLPNMIGENVLVNSAMLSVQPPIKNMMIRYTTDGTLPQSSSAILPSSFIIKKSTTVKLAAITNSGTRGDIYTLRYTKEAYNKPVMAANTFPGLTCSYYKSFFKNTLALQGAKADITFVIDSILVPASVNAPGFALQLLYSKGNEKPKPVPEAG